MCGIYGYIGKNNAYDVVLNGLKMLQYRGYDSCGIAYFTSKFKIKKAVGTLENLERPKQISNIAFGHTRWATNGAVNLKNTHPHISNHGEFIIVHNGIITNATKLKAQLIEQGFTFYSETDTEIIANLLESIEGECETKIKQLFSFLEGSFALIIGCKNGDIYLVKKFCPLNLLLDLDNDDIYISSDINSLKSGNLYILQDNDVIKISNNQIDNLSCKQPMTFIPHINDTKLLELGNFTHYMLKEIFETPTAVRNTYNHLCTVNLQQIFKSVKKITFLGCGTAYHSCLVGEILFREHLKLETEHWLASNYTINHRINKHHLHIIVSQSGETADCIQNARDIKANGGKILLITNENKSTLTHYADYVIATKAQKEFAVASTKTYCTQIFTFAYICNKMNNAKYELNIDDFAEKLQTYINNININNLADTISKHDKLILVGKGIDYQTLLEASLKIREIDYIFTLPIYAGELKHGTLSLIDENSLILSLDTTHKDLIQTSINEIKSRKGNVIEMEKYCNCEVEELFKPIYNIIPFQMLSYKIALIKGLNPDMPRNLAKSVTVH